MLEYILIIVLLVNIGLDIYIVKKVDAVKKNIRSNKDNSKSRLEKIVDGIQRELDNKAHVNITHDIWEELADLRTEIKSLKTKDVNTNLKSNSDNINTHESVMTIDTEKNLYEAQLYKLIDKVHKSKINNRYKIKDLDTEIKLFKDNSLAVVITSDIEESKVLGVSVYDIDDLDNIDLLYTS
jgi:hypothetical protein